MVTEVTTQGTIWTRAMPLPRAGARRGVGPAWGELRSLRGVVERLVFEDAEDGYVVARVTCDGPAGEPPAAAGGAGRRGTLARPLPRAGLGRGGRGAAAGGGGAAPAAGCARPA